MVVARRTLKRYGLESAARVFIAIGLLLILSSWILGAYYFSSTGGISPFIAPFIFTCVAAGVLLVIRYRYTLFEKYPYLLNLPSIFYRIGGRQNDAKKQSIAFSMIYTVHSLVMAFIGFMSLLLTVTIASRYTATLYVYLIVVAILIVSVFLLYRRIYIRLSN